MNERILHDALSALCKQYRKQNGTSQHALNNYRFDTFFFTKGDGLLAVGSEFEKNDGIIGEIINELETRDFIRTIGTDFVLTNKGFKVGSENILQKIVGYFNANSGWSIIISIFALVVSIIALYNSTKP